MAQSLLSNYDGEKTSDSPASSSTANALPPVPEAGADFPSNFPTMYWGVGSHNSIRAFKHLHDGEPFADGSYTVTPSDFPMADRLEISFTSENREKIFTGPKWFLDCGGFTELRETQDGKYSFGADDYVAWIAEKIDAGIDIEYWALRDWPLSDELLRTHGRNSKTHLNWTVRDHTKCLELAADYGLEQSGASPVTVIQGTDKTEYLWSLDYYREHGLLTDRVMIGSLKSLSPDEVEAIVSSVTDELPEKHTVHALGLTQRHFTETTVLNSIDATDTQSWNHARSRVPDLPRSHRNRRTGYLYAYAQYRADLIEAITQTPQEQGFKIPALYEHGKGRAAAVGHSNEPLIECLCGTIIDANDIRNAYEEHSETHIPTELINQANCRHCERRLTTLLTRCVDGIPDQFY